MMYANRLLSVPITTGNPAAISGLEAVRVAIRLGFLNYADRFKPDVWLDGRAQATPQLVPFSHRKRHYP